KLVQYVFGHARLLVGASGAHCFIGVGEADQPSMQRNRGAREAIRITVPVPALMMVANRGRHRRQHIDRAHHLVAGGRMMSNQSPVLYGEWSSFLQQRPRYADLADV